MSLRSTITRELAIACSFSYENVMNACGQSLEGVTPFAEMRKKADDASRIIGNTMVRISGDTVSAFEALIGDYAEFVPESEADLNTDRITGELRRDCPCFREIAEYQRNNLADPMSECFSGSMMDVAIARVCSGAKRGVKALIKYGSISAKLAESVHKLMCMVADIAGAWYAGDATWKINCTILMRSLRLIGCPNLSNTFAQSVVIVVVKRKSKKVLAENSSESSPDEAAAGVKVITDTKRIAAIEDEADDVLADNDKESIAAAKHVVARNKQAAK